MLWYCCRQLQTGNRLVRLLFSIASFPALECPVVWRCRESNSARYSAAGDGTHNCIFLYIFFRLPTSSGCATMKSVNVKLVCVSNVSAPAGDSGTRDPLATWVKIFPKSNGSVTAGKEQNSLGKHSQNHAPRRSFALLSRTVFFFFFLLFAFTRKFYAGSCVVGSQHAPHILSGCQPANQRHVG